jgi:hypothetical protein
LGVGDELADEGPQRLAVARVQRLEGAAIAGGNRPQGVGIAASREHDLTEGMSHDPVVRFTTVGGSGARVTPVG